MTKARYYVATRDWKGSYRKAPVGWELLAGEDEIKTNGDSLAQVFVKGKPKQRLSGQEVWDLHEVLLSRDDDKYELDPKDYDVVIER
jgi:hypothetical protein